MEKATPDQQAVMHLPGATDLLSTHTAIKASQGAIFDVPQPLHIKFASKNKKNLFIRRDF